MYNNVNQQCAFGTPITPMIYAEQLVNESFCVSYFHRQKLGRQLDQLIRLCGNENLFICDNGAYSYWKNTGENATEDYWLGFEKWAYDILRQAPQAVAIVPDEIDGSEDDNVNLLTDFLCGPIPRERMMPVWHLGDSVDYLVYLLESQFQYLAFGSSGQYVQPGTKIWHKRIAEAFDIVNKLCTAENAVTRPWLHMLRAQKQAGDYPFQSSDSTNLAQNHAKYKHVGNHVYHLADKIKFKNKIGINKKNIAKPSPAKNAINWCEYRNYTQWLLNTEMDERIIYDFLNESPIKMAISDYSGQCEKVEFPQLINNQMALF
jgi:hypothetical protein